MTQKISLVEFTAKNKANKTPVFSKIELKDGRKLITTHNGFKFFIVNKKETEVSPITENYYRKALTNRQTKNDLRNV